MSTGNRGGNEEPRAALVVPARPGVDLDALGERDTVPPMTLSSGPPAPSVPVARPSGESAPSARGSHSIATRVELPDRRELAGEDDDMRDTIAMSPVPRPGTPAGKRTAIGYPADAVAERAATPPDDAAADGAAGTEGEDEGEGEGEDTARDDRPFPALSDSAPYTPPAPERAALAGVLRDRDEAERDLLSVAAVIGERFWIGPLRSLVFLESPTTEREEWSVARTDDRLNGLLLRLQHGRLVSMREPSSIPGELEFSFVDPTDRAALLRQLPLARRERLHRGVAQWLEILDGTERNRWAARRAWHWEEGRRPESAARAYVDAARAFLATGALGEAARMLDRAAGLLDPECARLLADVHLERAEVLSWLGWFDEAARAARAALCAAQIISDVGRGGRALLARGLVALHTNGVMAAADRFSMADELLAGSDDREAMALCACARGLLRLVRGGADDVGRALEALGEAIGPAHELRGEEGVRVRLRALPALAEAQVLAGDGRAAERLLREARQLAERTNDVVAATVAERVAGDLDWARGRDGSAMERWDRALARATELDLRPEGVRLRVRLAEAFQARSGDDERAAQLLQVALDDAEMLGSRLLEAQALRGLARLGGPERIDRLHRAADLARRVDAGHELARIALVRADHAARSRDAEERETAAAALREARERLEASGNRPMLARVLVRLALLVGGEEAAALRARAQKLTANL